jgi:hypothetical protein
MSLTLEEVEVLINLFQVLLDHPDEAVRVAAAHYLGDLEISERRRVEREAALSVQSKDGLLSSEWVLRTGMAERRAEQAEARIEKVLALLANGGNARAPGPSCSDQ